MILGMNPNALTADRRATSAVLSFPKPGALAV
jgi:hypothetical protein